MGETQTLGQRIRAARKRKGWTQAQAGKALGLPLHAISGGYMRCVSLSNWECDRVIPQRRIHARLRDVLGVSVHGHDVAPRDKRVTALRADIETGLSHIEADFVERGDRAAAYVVVQVRRDILARFDAAANGSAP